MYISKRAMTGLLLIGFLLLSRVASAGVFAGNQLFVDNAIGNDGVSRAANTINSPWQTISKALLTAEPGDVVNFRAGTYYSEGIRANQFSTAKNGTSVNRIVFTNYQDEVVTFTGDGIKIDRQYWTFSGIDGVTADRVFWVGADGDTYEDTGRNIIIENGTFTLTQEGGGVNKAPIILQTGGAEDAIIRNNKFIGPGQYLNGNTAGIFIFRTKGVKILNNTFRQFPSALYYKHPGVDSDTGIEFANNYFHDNEAGIRTASLYANIHDNLFVRSSLVVGQGGGTGDSIVPDQFNQGGDFNTIEHNTFFSSRLDLIGLAVAEGSGATNNTLRDNLFSSAVYLIAYDNLDHKTILDNNLYVTGDSAVLNNKTFYSAGDWEGFYGQETNSITGTATYAGGDEPISIYDYALSIGSPGYKVASDGSDIGANVALISDGRSPKAPAVSIP